MKFGNLGVLIGTPFHPEHDANIKLSFLLLIFDIDIININLNPYTRYITHYSTHRTHLAWLKSHMAEIAVY